MYELRDQSEFLNFRRQNENSSNQEETEQHTMFMESFNPKLGTIDIGKWEWR